MALIKTKQIAFNLDDPYQKSLYEYAGEMTTNFSSYGKYLIKRDMNGWNNDEDKDNQCDAKGESSLIDFDIAKSFI